MNLDFATRSACLIALKARRAECAKQGLSTRQWDRAIRHFKSALLDAAAEEINSSVPAFLRRQAT